MTSKDSSESLSKRASSSAPSGRKKKASSTLKSKAKTVASSPSSPGKRESKLENTVLGLIERANLPTPCREYFFHPTRKWRFDFAWPEWMVALEVEGGIWRGGRHQTARGYTADCEKYSEAAILGWVVIRVTALTMKENKVIKLVTRGLESMGWERDGG